LFLELLDFVPEAADFARLRSQAPFMAEDFRELLHVGFHPFAGLARS
jgi:hypothetical protein